MQLGAIRLQAKPPISAQFGQHWASVSVCVGLVVPEASPRLGHKLLVIAIRDTEHRHSGLSLGKNRGMVTLLAGR